MATGKRVMHLPYDVTRCHGIISPEQKCDRVDTCLRHRAMETDPDDLYCSQALCLCYIEHGDPFYFYYIPLKDE